MAWLHPSGLDGGMLTPIKVKLVEVEIPKDKRYYIDVATGDVLQPGDAFWNPREHRWDCYYWENCVDPRGHLYVVLPDGSHWCVQSRAANCTLPKDKTHRCWVLHERPDGTLHVDKDGVTCEAGAGSIATDNWHGFLHDGHLA